MMSVTRTRAGTGCLPAASVTVPQTVASGASLSSASIIRAARGSRTRRPLSAPLGSCTVLSLASALNWLNLSYSV